MRSSHPFSHPGFAPAWQPLAILMYFLTSNLLPPSQALGCGPLPPSGTGPGVLLPPPPPSGAGGVPPLPARECGKVSENVLNTWDLRHIDPSEWRWGVPCVFSSTPRVDQQWCALGVNILEVLCMCTWDCNFQIYLSLEARDAICSALFNSKLQGNAKLCFSSLISGEEMQGSVQRHKSAKASLYSIALVVFKSIAFIF